MEVVGVEDIADVGSFLARFFVRDSLALSC